MAIIIDVFHRYERPLIGINYQFFKELKSAPMKNLGINIKIYCSKPLTNTKYDVKTNYSIVNNFESKSHCSSNIT